MTRVLTLVLLGSLLAAPARGQDLVYPLDVAIGKSGALYIVDRNLPGLWKATDGQLSIFFQAKLNAVRCISADGKGGLLVGDTGTREVYRFSTDGKSTPLTKGGIGIAMGIAVDAKGTIFVADLELQRVWSVPAAGGEPKEFAVLPAPRGMTFDKTGQLWVVSGGSKNQLVKIAPDGKITPVVKGRTFIYPNDVAIGPDGTAYVSDGYADCIWKVAPDGKATKWVSGKPLDNPVGLAWQKQTLLVVDSRAKQVFTVSPTGKLSAVKLEKK